MSTQPLCFKPDGNESYYFEINNISFSDWCHKHLEIDMGITKRKKLESVTNKFYLICFGLILYVLSQVLVLPATLMNLIVYLFMVIGAIVLICVGFFLLVREIMYLINTKKTSETTIHFRRLKER